MQTDHIIVTDGLTRLFGDTAAVDGLKLEVHSGEVFGFLGHNGAGKTTTVRLLNGVLNPSSGSARVLGLSPVDDGSALRRRTGVLTETPSMDERLTARDNLTIYADLYSVPENEVEGRVEELLADFELSERADEKVGGYSKGMKQRLALARALIHKPELLFLDEPTAGLDPMAARRVHQLVNRMSEEGRTIFLCTHNLVEAQRLCDRVAVLEHGRLLALGTPAELARQLGYSAELEIEVAHDDVSQALDILRSVPDIGDVSGGKNLVSASGVAHDAIPDLIETLVEAGVRVYRVTPGEASLEDVYFSLHGEIRHSGEVSA